MKILLLICGLILGTISYAADSGYHVIKKLQLGGHDPVKVYAAYRAAVEHQGSPTVILARTIKGYGLGESGEGRNITHQQKKLNEEELRRFRSRFGIPISDEDIAEAPFYKPADNSQEAQYIRERREKLGGYVPARKVSVEPIPPVAEVVFKEFLAGTEGREASTTMVFVRMLSKLLRDEQIGKLIVPFVVVHVGRRSANGSDDLPVGWPPGFDRSHSL